LAAAATGGPLVGREREIDRVDRPGMVRMSFGCYNGLSDIDRAVDGLRRIVAGGIAGTYRADADGSFHPAGHAEPMLFSLDHWR
jgi:hypothetical protein